MCEELATLWTHKWDAPFASGQLSYVFKKAGANRIGNWILVVRIRDDLLLNYLKELCKSARISCRPAFDVEVAEFGTKPMSRKVIASSVEVVVFVIPHVPKLGKQAGEEIQELHRRHSVDC